MTYIRSTNSNVQHQLMPSQLLADDAPVQLTYNDVMDMLDAAQLDAGDRYAHIPQLCEELQTQFRDGIGACNLRELDPVALLKMRLRQERLIFDAYNKHHLGNAAWRYYKATPAPKDEDQWLAGLGENIEEDLESFPLRCEVVTSGFDFLTEDLIPIYQIAEHAAQSVVESDQEPAIPQAQITRTAKTYSNDTTSSTKPKIGRATINYNKLRDAPPCNLDFPNGNITLFEQAAFLPEGFKSWDMIDRACGNGAYQVFIARMINASRLMPRGKIENNSVYRMFKGSMDKRAKEYPEWANWTTSAHDKYPKPTNFDPASVSVTGFRTPADGKKKASAPPIPMKDLAKGVKVFPTGYDALDLTRAVRHCVNHPEEIWMFPDDYVRLVSHLPQDPQFAGYPPGPAPVQPEHQDAAVLARWTSPQMVASVRNAKGRKRDSHGRLLKKDSDKKDFDILDSGSGDDSDGDIDKKGKKGKRNTLFDGSDDDEFDTPSRRPNKCKKLAPNLRLARKSSDAPPPSRLHTELFADDFDSDSDADAYVGSKRANKKVSEIRRSGRNTKVAVSYNVDDTLGDIDDENEDVDAPVSKKTIMISRNGMDAEMCDGDEFEHDD